MAFVVEDGTGLVAANSYVSVDYADAYCTDRGLAAWTGDDLAKQTYLVRATDYVELVFGRRWVGTMLTTTQGLSWPREPEEGAADFTFQLDPDDGLPVLLKRAVCEYGVRAVSLIALAPDPVIDDTGYSVVTTRKAVGPIEKEFRPVGSNMSPRTIRPYPQADMLLSSLLTSGTGGARVTR